MSRTWRLSILFALQALALVYMVADRQWLLANGRPVILETEPVDPRSLFSGDYVRLRYRTLSHLSLTGLDGDREFARHDRVYVVLQPGEPYWRVVSVHATMPPATPEQVVLRGVVSGSDVGARNTDYAEVYYGIESYFIAEGEGQALERPQPGETVSIRVAVDARGRAAIQALLVNGKERVVERWY